MKLPIDEFSASMGLPMTPKIRFLNQKTKGQKEQKEASLPLEVPVGENLLELSTKTVDNSVDDEEEDGFLVKKESPDIEYGKETSSGNILPVTRIGKKKKLKINIHRPAGTRVVFDDEGSTLPLLATIADMSGSGSPVMDREKVRTETRESN